MDNLAIRAENFTKRFGDFTAVDNISFEVEKGEIFGFLGANGAGKTTAMKMLTGLLRPSSGKAMVAGFDVYKEAENIKKNIGYMSQKFSLYNDLTVLENIELALQAFKGNIPGLYIRLRAHAIGGEPFFNLRNQVLNMLIVQAQDGYPVKRDAVDKTQKSRFDIIDALIVIQVFLIDIGDHGHGRAVFQK